MAGSKLMMHSKVKASSILEVVISMVIIMAVFGIAMIIFANVVQSSLSTKKLKAEAILNETMLDATHLGNNISRTFNTDGFQIEQVVNAYPDNKALEQIDLTAFDANGKKITELHKVIILEND